MRYKINSVREPDIQQISFNDQSEQDPNDPMKWFWINDVEETTPQKLFKYLKHQNDLQLPLSIIGISSFGGDAYAALEIFDIIETFKEKMVIATVSTGKAMSAGSFIATCGTNGFRFGSTNCCFMIHHVSAGANGKIKELEVTVRESRRINDQLFKIMSTNCRQEPNFFSTLINSNDHADLFLSSEDAKKYGMIDRVALPQFSIEIKPDFDIKIEGVQLSDEEIQQIAQEEKNATVTDVKDAAGTEKPKKRIRK